MSMKTLIVALFGLCFGTQIGATTIWAPQDSPQAAQLGNYRAATCKFLPPPAYTGALLLQSKYDPSDATKSTPVAEQDALTKEVQERVKSYVDGLIQGSKQFQSAKSSSAATLAIGCFDQWLEAWARDGALLNKEANSTGMAVRKWALAAVAGSVLRVQALTNNRYQLSAVERHWFSQLAEQVVTEYQPRRTPKFHYFNNHDYWAGWAVSATGMLLNRDDFIAWGDQSLRLALAQVVVSSRGDYAYLPLEVARGGLASSYMQFALVPLVLLADAADANGLTLNMEEQRKLQLLSTFAARAVLEPQMLAELKGTTQETPADYKLVWLIPFLARFPQQPWVRELYKSRNGKVDNYSQIGGAIKDFYKF